VVVVVGAIIVRQGAYNWVGAQMLDKISVERERWADSEMRGRGWVGGDHDIDVSVRLLFKYRGYT
jgi:hypothetical protein